MKAKFIKGTTWRGRLVNDGDVLDLDEKDYNLFVRTYKDAVPYVEPEAEPPKGATPNPGPVAATEVPIDEKKGKKKV